MRILLLVFLVCIFLLVSPFVVESAQVDAEMPLQAPIKPTVKSYAENRIISTFGTGWAEFDKLIQRESQWNPLAQNPNSSAYGLGQFINSTWKYVGCEKTNDPYIQIDCTITYVKKVYGTPQKALEFHKQHNYY